MSALAIMADGGKVIGPVVEYGYRLAHAYEREVTGGFRTPNQAHNALRGILKVQPGADGVVVHRPAGESWALLDSTVTPWWWTA